MKMIILHLAPLPVSQLAGKFLHDLYLPDQHDSSSGVSAGSHFLLLSSLQLLQHFLISLVNFLLLLSSYI